ncbi:MAG: DUF177 domain-containing protein [Alphaproteobacteria bacterium]|nr:DUF177 domain-containing protein [Alphaproteobacteria bacterium]
MSTSAPEFSRIERLDMLGRGGDRVRIEADPQEREALRQRFGLMELSRLAAEYVLARDVAVLANVDGSIMARGRIEADLVQACVATGTAVPESINESFTIRFERASAALDPDAEIELNAEDCDVIYFSGDQIDMGEAVAETLSLTMKPYPRAHDADRVLREVGVLKEEDVGPFAKLRELTKKN